MSSDSVASPLPEVTVSRPIYRLEQINQSLCYENQEVSGKCLNYNYPYVLIFICP